MRMAENDPEDVLNADPADSAPPKWLPFVIVGLGVLAFANSLGGPFIFDDIDSIPKNPQIRHLWPLRQAMAAPPMTSVSGRPVVCLSLAMNYAISGLNVWSYHVF